MTDKDEKKPEIEEGGFFEGTGRVIRADGTVEEFTFRTGPLEKSED